MGSPNVGILLSTYNGEKYLPQLITSILKQTYANWHLYIRDDGSSDNTVSVIHEFVSRDPRVEFINCEKGKNLGVVHSFFSLLENVDVDFYMFSDQDDYWLPDKVEKTLNRMLSLEHKKIPICVYTNLKVVDKDLKGNSLLLSRSWQSFQELLFTNNAYGCTMMINQLVKDLINFDQINYANIFMHDWWLALITAAFGKVSYINEPTILYRQHGDNQVGASNKSFVSICKRVLDNHKDRQKLQQSINYAEELLSEYDECQFNTDDYRYVLNYGKLHQNSSLGHNIKIGIITPPKMVHKMKELFYVYILVMYSKDYIKKK
ncbi:MAG: glycosyltransferase family 2 protein [Limosilactobacillus oris]|jgi:rhamnosyltransferase|uniref:glycosyltransferase family 2 protein n=1 Tax=Limosilactobacillus oris TaxID=1632 RepID=UPI00242B0896|nr:glycosyltransferase family 2 protein [Limosilactobacillus oris]MCH3910261.1 glycosyltransferase family 2 protein [Limosilactobacillus oris]MCH3939388.1 glycosyltransferase family 2 protein [Limosilactobacillus oris]MCI1980728.1 glycosyltransferase family 2 protein [Limosilactobacillus oris]MCI2043122.1 glycosyltransferase family 2 protein [Limosilactobacillus oris]